MAVSQHLREVNVLLFGKTGAGKSTLGNFLIQREKFEVVSGFLAGTGKAAKGSCPVNVSGDHFTMHVFDTPGLAEAARKDSQNLAEIINGIKLIVGSGEPVIHVMIYVLSAADRFTIDEAQIVQYFANEGKNFWSHFILVITNGERYGRTDEERCAKLYDMLRHPKCPPDLKSLTDNLAFDNKQRIIIIESKAEKYEIQAKRNELLKMIQKLSCIDNEGCVYDFLKNAKSSLIRNPSKVEEEINTYVTETIKKNTSCFPGESTIITKDGVKFMYEINPGDEVLAITPGGSIIFSEVVTFLHYEPKTFATYMTIQTMSGTLLHVSGNHLVFSVTPDIASATFKSKAVMATCIKPGDYILEIKSPSSQIQSTQVTSIDRVRKQGVYAPMTQCGTIVVDSFVASCYASYPSHTIAHAVMAPLRIYYNITKCHRRGVPVTEGVNSYAAFLYKLVY